MPAPRLLLAGAVGALLLAGTGAAALWPGAAARAQDALRGVRDLGGLGLLAVAAAQLLVAASGVLPASLVGVAAGAVYGLALGFALAAAGTMAGALLAFRLGRSLFRPVVARAVARRPRLRGLDAMVARDGWRFVCLLRLSPVMPFAVTSYALGLTAARTRDYLLGTLASLPALFGYVALGAAAETGFGAWHDRASALRWALAAAGALVTVALSARIGRAVVSAGTTSPRSASAG